MGDISWGLCPGSASLGNLKRYSFCLFVVVSQWLWRWMGWELPGYFRLIFHICLMWYYSACGGRHSTVYPKKYADGFCFAVLCCGYTLTDFPISIRLTSLALWQSNDCPSASKATLMNMDKYFMWIHYERLQNHNKAKHNKTVCIFLGIYCMPCLTMVMSQVFWVLSHKDCVSGCEDSHYEDKMILRRFYLY